MNLNKKFYYYNKIDTDVYRIINHKKDNFIVVAAYSGFFGSLVYRVITGSDEKFVWDKKFSSSNENLNPLQWPKYIEGFTIYNKFTEEETKAMLNGDVIWNPSFRENHATAAHIGIEVIENMSPRDLIKYFKKDKVLLLRTHHIYCYQNLECKFVRVCGNLRTILPKFNKTGLRYYGYKNIYPVGKDLVYDLNIEKLLNDDYDIFLDEYLSLCSFLDIFPNVNNVRSFILLFKERLKRFHLTLS